MTPTGLRKAFEKNVSYVATYLYGFGFDMGCGNCPLHLPRCVHIDHAPQPIAVDDRPDDEFIIADIASVKDDRPADYIFSSHAIEDLPSRQAIVDCLKHWQSMLTVGGHIVLLVPDMQGGRYPNVASGGNPSHRVDVGVPFFNDIFNDLYGLSVAQINTIPRDASETLDVIFYKYGNPVTRHNNSYLEDINE